MAVPVPQAAPSAPAAQAQPTAPPQVTVPLAEAAPTSTNQGAPGGKPLLVTGGAAAPVSPPVPPAPAPEAQPSAPPAGVPLGATPNPPAQALPGQSPSQGVSIGSVGGSTKKGISMPVKVMIAATMIAAIIVAAIVYTGKSARNEEVERLNEITGKFKDQDNPPTEIAMTESDVDLLLNEMLSTTSKDGNERESYFRALNIAKATDGTDISAKIAEFAAGRKMESPLRQKLFQLVGRRGEAGALDALIGFASQSDDTAAAGAALRAAGGMATTSNFQSLLSIITNSPNGSIKSEAVKVLSGVISSSDDPASYSASIIGAFKSVADDNSSAALLRLMGSTGTDEAADIVMKTLEEGNEAMKTGAIYALRYWPDDSQFETLLEFATDEDSDRLRKEAFESLINFLKECEGVDPDDKSLYWNDVAVIATGQTEQMYVISSMVEQSEAWADDILDYFIENSDSDRVQGMAEKAKDKLATRIQRAKRSGKLDEDDSDDKDDSDE